MMQIKFKKDLVEDNYLLRNFMDDVWEASFNSIGEIIIDFDDHKIVLKDLFYVEIVEGDVEWK